MGENGVKQRSAGCSNRSHALAGFTAKHNIHELASYELFGELKTGALRMSHLKRWHRRWNVNLVESDSPRRGDLAVALGLPPTPPRSRGMGPETSSG